MINERVYVWHSGVLKVGVLRKLGRRSAKVEVPVGLGDETKLITVRSANLILAEAA